MVWSLKFQTMNSHVWIEVVSGEDMKFSKNSQKFHFCVTKKDPGLVFHFHVWNLFKCWSNLGLTDFKISIKNSKNIKKNGKHVHMVLVCHILTTQVDKQGIDTFKRNVHVCSVISQISNYELSSVKRSGSGRGTWNFQKTHKSFILVWLRRIQAWFFIFMFETCLNVGQS